MEEHIRKRYQIKALRVYQKLVKILGFDLIDWIDSKNVFFKGERNGKKINIRIFEDFIILRIVGECDLFFTVLGGVKPFFYRSRLELLGNKNQSVETEIEHKLIKKFETILKELGSIVG